MRASLLSSGGRNAAVRGVPALGMAAMLAASACWQGAEAAEVPIADAARVGDAAEVRALIAAGADVGAAEPDGTTALLWAAYQSDLEIVEALLAAGADPNAANDFGVTPLLQASRYGDAAVIEALLAAGADVAATHAGSEPPLLAAARAGSVEAVTLLLAHGSDPNAVEPLQEQTALMWAADEGHLEVVDTLLSAGADPNMRARETTLTERSINSDFPTGGFTALMFAVRDGDETVAKRLLERGANPTLRNGDGATATIIAIVNDRFDFAAELVELGADPDDGSLYHAVVMRDATTDWLARDGSRLRPDHPNELTALGLIEALLEAGADPNTPFVGQLHNRTMCCDTFENGTPLFRAAVAADVAALELLIRHGGDLEWAPESVPGQRVANVGKTPLMVAMTGGQGVGMAGGPGDIREGEAPPFREQSNRNPADAVRVLLEAGADPDAVTPDGAAALHEAVRRGKLEIVRLLADAGATLDLPDGDGLTPLELAEQPPEPAGPPGVPMPAEDRADPEEIAALLRELLAARGGEAPPAQASLDRSGTP